MLSMNVESFRERHPSNYTLIEDGRLAILRYAAILGPNASGKSNLLRAIGAIKWMILSSSGRKEGQSIPPYEPFLLSESGSRCPVALEIEFVVPSGTRYRYEISFSNDRVEEERLYSFSRRSRATVFSRNSDDTWETIKFGSTYKGGNRKFPFFRNAAYLSRAGNDASSPYFIREIYDYFEKMKIISSEFVGDSFFSRSDLDNRELSAISKIIRLADTGVERVTIEDNKFAKDVRLPEGIPEELKKMIIDQNRKVTKYWILSQFKELVAFDARDMSQGTVQLYKILPIFLSVLRAGSVLIFDEIDVHFHKDLVALLLRLFRDNQINLAGAQMIFSTHDTTILDSSYIRRDQVWLASKKNGASSLRSLDEYDKKHVRHDSSFESLYRNGRLGALPRVSYLSLKRAVLDALERNNPVDEGEGDA